MKFLILFSSWIFLVQCRPQQILDQKQNGEFNIQVHLKDLQIIALLGDEALEDYDYNYDYSDFTVKPPGLKPPPETNATTSTTSASISTSTTSASTSTTSASTTASSNTASSASVPFSTSSPDRIKVQIIEEPSDLVPVVQPVGQVLPKKCAQGYTRDKRGRCRRVRKPAHQFDIGRLASSLAARIRGNTREDSLQ